MMMFEHNLIIISSNGEIGGQELIINAMVMNVALSITLNLRRFFISPEERMEEDVFLNKLKLYQTFS